MVPPEFANFFLGSTGASATLIGLLFIAVSIEPERVFGSGASAEQQATAAGAFTALANVFFISLGALIPNTNLGGFVLVMGAIGLSNTLTVGWGLVRELRQRRLGGRRAANATMLVLVGFVIYGLELWHGWSLLHAPSETGYVWVVALLLLFVFGFGLVRAWELLGARRRGLLTWLISPREQEDDSHSRTSPGNGPSRPDREPGERGS
jgi:hypothetical protein